MPNVQRFSLRGAVPQQGMLAQISGKVDDGRYCLEIGSLTRERSKSNPTNEQFVLRMRVVDDDDFSGVPIVERFSIPGPGNDSMVGINFFYAFLLEMGCNIDSAATEDDIEMDFEEFTGQHVDADLVSSKMEANGRYEARPISRVDLYHHCDHYQQRNRQQEQPRAGSRSAGSGQAQRPAQTTRQATQARQTQPTTLRPVQTAPTNGASETDDPITRVEEQVEDLLDV